MPLPLSILATLALFVSTLAHVMMAVGTKGFTLRTPSGPDAMGIVVFFIFNIFGWVLTFVAAVLVAAGGAFGWLTNPPAAATVLVALACVSLAFVSLVSMGFSLERSKPGRTLSGWSGALTLPLVTNGLLGSLAWMEPAASASSGVVKIVAGALAIVAVLGLIVGLAALFVAQGRSARRMAEARTESDRRDEQNRAEQLALDARHNGELDALPDDAPLARFTEHLFIDKSDAHHALAFERIARLPNLAARFDQELMDPDPLAREYLLNYFRVAPSLDPALAAAITPAVARCFEHLAEDLHWLAAEPEHRAYGHVRGMTLGLLLSASRIPTRFAQPARTLRLALDHWPDQTTRQSAQELIDRYLAGQALK